MIIFFSDDKHTKHSITLCLWMNAGIKKQRYRIAHLLVIYISLYCNGSYQHLMSCDIASFWMLRRRRTMEKPNRDHCWNIVLLLAWGFACSWFQHYAPWTEHTLKWSSCAIQNYFWKRYVYDHKARLSCQGAHTVNAFWISCSLVILLYRPVLGCSLTKLKSG